MTSAEAKREILNSNTKEEQDALRVGGYAVRPAKAYLAETKIREQTGAQHPALTTKN